MQLKPTVKLSKLNPQIIIAMMVLDSVYAEHSKDLVITAINDGQHMQGSKHYTGDAFDARTKYFKDWERKNVFAEIRERLPIDFDIVDEVDHFHVEYDPK